MQITQNIQALCPCLSETVQASSYFSASVCGSYLTLADAQEEHIFMISGSASPHHSTQDVLQADLIDNWFVKYLFKGQETEKTVRWFISRNLNMCVTDMINCPIVDNNDSLHAVLLLNKQLCLTFLLNLKLFNEIPTGRSFRWKAFLRTQWVDISNNEDKIHLHNLSLIQTMTFTQKPNTYVLF